MPPVDEKINTTLREVIGDSINQAGKKSDDNKSQHTQTGEKREFIAGIDISDLPDNLSRADLKGLLEKKAALLESGYQGKFKEIAEFKKERDAIVALGVTPQKASEIIKDALKNSDSKLEVKKELKRELEQLRDEAADQETRKGVDRLGRVVHEEVENSPGYKKLLERLEKAEKALGYVQNKTIQSRVESLNESLTSLSGEKFDKDFIEKYREKVVENGKAYPDATVHKILQVIADPEEYDDALLKSKKKEEVKKSRLDEKIRASDSASAGVTGQNQEIDVKKVSLKGLIRQVMTKH